MSEVRLIDANALKEVAYINKGNFNTVEGIREWIDNAPTVVPEDFMHSYEEGYERARKDFERPHGNWVVTKLQSIHSEDVTCPFCNARPTRSEYGYYLKDNFCHECGADMRHEKKVKIPSCLTDPERYAELLERYMEE
jgi:hypothetical protein